MAFFIPESPIYLVRFEKETKAAKALEQLYGSQYDSLSEVSIIKRNLEELNREHSMNNNTSLADKFKINARKSEIYKPFLVLVTLTLVQQFSGMTVLRSYVVIIFDNIFNPDGDLNPPPDSSNSTTTTTTVVDSTTSSYSGSTGDCDNHHDTTSRYAYLSAVLIALVRLVSSLLLSKLLRNYRRRTMYMFSSSVTILALLSFATATLLLDRDISSALATAMTWTSLAAACLLVFGVQLGIQTLPNLLSGELFPSDLRAWCKSISRCITSIFIVVVVKAFPALVRAIEIYGTFYLFAVITALSLPLVYYVMPETMNLSLECIQKYFLPQRTVFYIDLEEPEGEGEEEEEAASKANGPQ